VRATSPPVKVSYLEKELQLVSGRQWEAEISGRLLSEANDIRERAIGAATARQSNSIKFRHVIYVKVSDVRKNDNLDVYAEPNEDHAHANLVAKKMPEAPQITVQATPKVAHEIYRALAAILSVCDADDLSPVEKLRVQQATL
jgi:hypothetical protein